MIKIRRLVIGMILRVTARLQLLRRMMVGGINLHLKRKLMRSSLMAGLKKRSLRNRRKTNLI